MAVLPVQPRFWDVEEILSPWGIDVSFDMIRYWTFKFGPLIAGRLKKPRVVPTPRWHPGEMVCWIGGSRSYLWRALDDQDEVLDLVAQRRCDPEAAPWLLERLI